jgi:hypothetical protein
MEQKKRLRSSLIKAAIILLVGLAYAAFVRLTGWGIPCIFYQLSGKLCPGCGISRMFLALLKLDFRRALQCNALVLLLLPVAAALGLRRWILYVKTGDTEPDSLEKWFLIPTAVLTALFWVLRNLPAFSFLVP